MMEAGGGSQAQEEPPKNWRHKWPQSLPKTRRPAILPEKEPEQAVDFTKNFQKRVGITTESLKKFFKMAENQTEFEPDISAGQVRQPDPGPDQRGHPSSRFRTGRIHGAIDTPGTSPSSRPPPPSSERSLHYPGLFRRFSSSSPTGISRRTECITSWHGHTARRKRFHQHDFLKIHVPLARSVVSARGPRFTTTGSATSMLVFEPVRTTVADEAIGEIVTRIMQKMTPSSATETWPGPS